MRRFVVLLMIAAVCSIVPTPAFAGCGYVDHVTMVQGATQINSVYVCDDAPSGGGEQVSLTSSVRDSDLDPLCVQEALTIGVGPFTFCQAPGDAESTPEVTPGVVGRAFRRLPLPASELVVQPPGGRTLVNFATNFYTENGEFMRTVSLLGQRVELRIWPAGYGWRFGDGATRQTVGAGSPYPDLEITHRYLSRGRVAPRVDTTY
ncbi:MAG: hypothetical protein JWN91_3924, partial [Nocardioides sp.]|nr:hypothetical protein [Nocardioides sp.]